MSVDLDATVGGASANAFVDVDTAADYLNTRLNASAWVGASPDDQARALIEATRELTVLPYLGSRVTNTQALAWPRQFCPNPDMPSVVFLGNIQLLYYDTTIISPRIINMTCELALEFLRAGTSDVAGLDPTTGVIRKKVDVLETQFAQPYERPRGLSRFPRIVANLTPLIDPSAGVYDVARV